MQKINLSITAVIIACLAFNFSLKLWEKQDRVIEHDVHHYYSYLPLAFIYNDLRIEKSDYRMGDNYYLVWPLTTEDGRKTIKNTMGMAFLYAPFFFVAHGLSHFIDYPANGYTEIYKFFLQLSALFYLFIGLLFLHKILKHLKFNDNIISFTILLVGLGTNLFCYSSHSSTMPHVYNFCLVSIFVYYTILWHDNPKLKHTFIIGLMIGLLSLIRPSNIIVILFFFLYGVTDIRSLKACIKKISFKHILIVSLCIFSIWLPQYLYWKHTTGHYIFYSYTDERFFFNKPKIIDGLFSFRKGWLTYTPVMFFALTGIALLKNNLKQLQLATIIFISINVYIIFSWWCWWYGGTYGQRSFIDFYAILAIPLAAAIRFIFEKKLIYKLIFVSMSAFFIWLNIFQTYQFEYHSLHFEAMTQKLYFKQFGKLHKIPDADKYLVWPNYDEAKKGNR